MTLSEQLELSVDRSVELKKHGLSPIQVTKMLLWIEENDWCNYSGIDEWIKPPRTRVVGTETLIKIFKGEMK